MNFNETAINNLGLVAKLPARLSRFYIESMLVKEGEQHSIPNKLVATALALTIAFICGFPIWLITAIGTIALVSAFTMRRWAIELLLVASFWEFGIMTAHIDGLMTIPMETSAVAAFLFLTIFRLTLEAICALVDKLIQLYASWTKNQSHSYYFFWVIVSAVPVAALKGFAIGYLQGLGGM